MKKLPQAIAIEPHPSRRLGFFVSGIHSVTLLMLILLQLRFGSLPFVWLVIPVLFSWYRSWHRLVSLRDRLALVRVELSPRGEWTLIDRRGKVMPAQLLGSSFVTTWLLTLNFSLGGLRRRSMILLADSADPDLLRRLRVRLRMEGINQSGKGHRRFF